MKTFYIFAIEFIRGEVGKRDVIISSSTYNNFNEAYASMKNSTDLLRESGCDIVLSRVIRKNVQL